MLFYTRHEKMDEKVSEKLKRKKKATAKPNKLEIPQQRFQNLIHNDYKDNRCSMLPLLSTLVIYMQYLCKDGFRDIDL